jgi:MFS superfamily sulfate permease-like transporter
MYFSPEKQQNKNSHNDDGDSHEEDNQNTLMYHQQRYKSWRGSSHYHHLHNNNDDDQDQHQARSYEDDRSSRHSSSFMRYYYHRLVVSSQQKEWQIVSPMTQHVLLQHDHPKSSSTNPTSNITVVADTDTSSVAVGAETTRKPRSKSFNDYLDRFREKELPITYPALMIPDLQQQEQKLRDPLISTNVSYKSASPVPDVDPSHNNDRASLPSPSSLRLGEQIQDNGDGDENRIGNDHDNVSNRYNAEMVTDTGISFTTSSQTNNITPSEKWLKSDQAPLSLSPLPLPLSPDDGHERTDNGVNEENNPLYISILYGAINCTIVTPVVMSFGNIIYRDEAFAPYMTLLIKLTLISGFVHQMCFTAFSTLPFAVGSVQDAGLIFLSTMATDIVAYCRNAPNRSNIIINQNNNIDIIDDSDDEIMLATVTIGLALATASLGIGLIVIAKLGLARYVQMLPTCVVAGYLAYIGWFVGYSGLGIMIGTSAVTIPLLFDHVLYVVPGIAGGIFIYLAVQKIRHVAVLPCCITISLLAFYLALVVSGSSIDEATENGWIRPSEQASSSSRHNTNPWEYLNIEKVAWGALPPLGWTWSGMLLVVALSSSLDVAAIELEMKRPLNYNRELTMVGISNLVSGMTGGYTGSYIFSQSIFSLRIGIRSRMAGLALAAFQLVILMIPFPVLSYVPNFFYGSLLFMIAIDLVVEWLWEFRHKVTVIEYLVGLSTFALIHVGGVEYGILAGVVIYSTCRYLNIIQSGQGKQQEQLQTTQRQDPLQKGDDSRSSTAATGNDIAHQETTANGNAASEALADRHHLTEREQLLHLHQNGTNNINTYSSC